MFTPRVFGPIAPSRLALMGIRFAEGEEGAAPAAPVAPELPVAPAAPVAPASDAVQNVADLPDWAQKVIADTRKEAGDHRAAAKTAERAFADKIAVALGLKSDAATDPAALTASLAAAQAAASTSARELAVFRAASGIADPAKLLDRTSFTTSIAGIDPSDGPAMTAAIEAAVLADPNLKSARAAGASGIPLGGPEEQGHITQAQLAQMTPEQIYAAHRKGELSHLF